MRPSVQPIMPLKSLPDSVPRFGQETLKDRALFWVVVLPRSFFFLREGRPTSTVVSPPPSSERDGRAGLSLFQCPGVFFEPR
jgi:hypothetical protein